MQIEGSILYRTGNPIDQEIGDYGVKAGKTSRVDVVSVGGEEIPWPRVGVGRGKEQAISPDPGSRSEGSIGYSTVEENRNLPEIGNHQRQALARVVFQNDRPHVQPGARPFPRRRYHSRYLRRPSLHPPPVPQEDSGPDSALETSPHRREWG